MIGLAALHAGAIPLGRTRALLLALAICVGWNLMLLGLSLNRRRVLLAARPKA